MVSARWYHVNDNPVRFNDLCRMLGGASRKMVDQRLKELEANGMVKREVLETRPIAVAYQLTDYGRSALVILEQMRVWMEQHQA